MQWCLPVTVKRQNVIHAARCNLVRDETNPDVCSTKVLRVSIPCEEPEVEVMTSSDGESSGEEAEVNLTAPWTQSPALRNRTESPILNETSGDVAGSSSTSGSTVGAGVEVGGVSEMSTLSVGGCSERRRRK